MLPEHLLLKNFILPKRFKAIPADIHQCKTLTQDQLTYYIVEPFGITVPLPDDHYVYAGSRSLLELNSRVFVYKDAAYKIKTIMQNTLQFTNIAKSTILTIEEYTDPYVEELKARCAKIKQHLSVCTDIIEELGGLRLASTTRQLEKEYMLEDLV